MAGSGFVPQYRQKHKRKTKYLFTLRNCFKNARAISGPTLEANRYHHADVHCVPINSNKTSLI